MFVQEGNYRHYHGHGMDTYPHPPHYAVRVGVSLCSSKQYSDKHASNQETPAKSRRIARETGEMGGGCQTSKGRLLDNLAADSGAFVLRSCLIFLRAKNRGAYGHTNSTPFPLTKAII